MSKQMVEGSGNCKDSLQICHLVPNAKDASAYPGNEEGSVQPTTVIPPNKTERKNSEQEHLGRDEERKHHKELGH
jgi:hypothetical protein